MVNRLSKGIRKIDQYEMKLVRKNITWATFKREKELLDRGSIYFARGP